MDIFILLYCTVYAADINLHPDVDDWKARHDEMQGDMTGKKTEKGKQYWKCSDFFSPFHAITCMCCNEFVISIPTSFGVGGSVNIFVHYHHNHPLTILDLLQKWNNRLYCNWLTANIFCETTEQNLFTFQRSSIRQAKDTKQAMI
jgi:hypothetical protein